MDRRQYLRETSAALRKAEDRREEQQQTQLEVVGDEERGGKALDRFAEAMRREGLEYDGERWQCPSCRSQGHGPEVSLELRLDGKQVEFHCERDCRPNTIRALLGVPPYFPTLGHARTVGRFPYR